MIEEENEEEEQQQHQQQEISQQVPEENKNTTSPILLQEQQRELKNSIQLSRTPPYPERLALEKPIVPPEFDIEAELRNLCVKIPLLQTIRYIPILAKTIRDLCIKKPRIKRKQHSTI